MRVKILYLSILSVVISSSSVFASGLLFRVQCFPLNAKNQLEVMNNIPQKKKYLMPGGASLYFSGDYFGDYMEAKARLDEVKGIGFQKAFIRVFKERKILSKQLGDQYLAKQEERLSRIFAQPKQDNERLRKGEFNEKVVKRRFVFRANGSASKQPKRYTKSEYNKLIVSKTLEAANKADSLQKIAPAPKQKEKKEESNPFTSVDEMPIYKVQLIEGESGKMEASKMDKVSDVLYSYREGKKTVFAVGYFKNGVEAKGTLKRYSKKGFEKAKIIGVYKGKVVSEGLANQLAEEYVRIQKDLAKK